MGAVLKHKNEKMKLRIIKIIALTAGIQFSVNASSEVLLEHSGTIEAGTEYHSNFQFLQQDAESVNLYSLTPRYQLKALDGLNEWSAQLGILLQRSSNTNIQGRREDPFATVGWVRELENGQFGLSADYKKQSTRQTQLFDTGLVAEDGTNVTKAVVANWITSVTEKVDLIAEAGYSRNKFVSADQLNDFSTRNVNAEFRYLLSERVTPFIRVGASDFRGVARIEFQDYLAGASFLIRPEFEVKGGLGVTRFSTLGESEGVGFVQADYSQAKSVVSISLARAAFANGGINEIDIGDRMSANYDYELTETSGWGAAFQLGQNKSGQKTQEGRVFYNRSLSPTLSMDIFGGVTNINFVGGSSVNNNTAGISFTYSSLKY